MKKMYLAGLAAIALGPLQAQAEEPMVLNVIAEVESACSFGTPLSGDIDLVLTGTSFSKDISLGTSSCNATTYWNFESLYGGLQSGSTGYDGPFATLIKYDATVTGAEGNTHFQSENATGANGYDGSPLAPFLNKVLTLGIDSDGVDPTEYLGGDYSDRITINVTFAP